MPDHHENRTAFVGNSRVTIGRFTYGLENLSVRQWGEGASLSIGSFCSLADNIRIILGGNHRTDWITTFPFGHIFQEDLGTTKVPGHPSTKGDVVIGNDVWIGSSVTIMSGVTIGDGACIAANACVTKDVAPYHVVGGNPGRSLKERFDAKTIEMLLTLRWWELPLDDIKQLSSHLCAAPDLPLLVELVARYRKTI